eukprot:364072-Chlamydomonas_euryale.AAC.6
MEPAAVHVGDGASDCPRIRQPRYTWLDLGRVRTSPRTRDGRQQVRQSVQKQSNVDLVGQCRTARPSLRRPTALVACPAPPNARHCLQICRGVPVRVKQHKVVGAHEVEAGAARTRGQHEDLAGVDRAGGWGTLVKCAGGGGG